MGNQQEKPGRGRRSFWTWGWQSDEPTPAQRQEMANHLSKRFGREISVPDVPSIENLELRAPRISVPDSLSSVVTTDKTERVIHTYGGHFLELNRALRGDFEEPPDAVAYPEDENQIEAVLDWCDLT